MRTAAAAGVATPAVFVRALLVLHAVSALAAPSLPPVGSCLEARLARDDVEVHRTRTRADAVVALDLRNGCGKTVRFEAVRFVYLRAGDAVGGEDPGIAFFRDAVVPRVRRLEPARRARWIGLCLNDPPAGADAARIEIDVSRRRGLGRVRETIAVPLTLHDAPAPVLLHLPFEGTWAVSQAHGCEDDHRLAAHGGEYAWDFVALDAETKRPVGREWERRHANEDTAGFDRPVLAPADGTVVRVIDEIADNEGAHSFPRRSILDEVRRPEWGLGNRIVLQIGSGAYVLLGHLRRGSITVRPGDSVRAGDEIARCGNSGNSILPHVHLQVMDRPDPSDAAVRPLPARFVAYRETVVAAEGDRRDALIRDVEVGHPEQRSVLRPIAISAGDRRDASSRLPSAARP